MSRIFERDTYAVRELVTITGHDVEHATICRLPDGPPKLTSTEYELKPGHVEAYINEILIARGFVEKLDSEIHREGCTQQHDVLNWCRS